MSKVYRRVGIAKPSYSAFNMSYTNAFTADMQKLYPFFLKSTVPGDLWTLAVQAVVRANPMVAPVLTPIDIYVHFFEVNNRIMWDDWEDYITGGDDGTAAPTLPTWNVSTNTLGSLWDYCGMPVGVTPTGFLPTDFMRRAYNMIYNEYYRDETLISEVALTNETILTRSWAKDRFTSAALNEQKGTAPSLPVTITGDGGDIAVYNSVDATPGNLQTAVTTGNVLTGVAPSGSGNMRWSDPGLSATAFDINDLREAVAIQRWLERNSRAGSRYREHSLAHYGIALNDYSIQIPRYIGGARMNLITSEVLQTSQTDAALEGGGTATPQGNMAGHGISVQNKFVGKVRCREHGLIMGILSIMPRAVYHQGVDREWYKTSRYDYYSPEFANIGEDAIYRGEIYANAVSGDNQTVFGYQGRFDELRISQNKVTGKMRPGQTFDHWNIARNFSSAPTLSQTFLEGAARKDWLAASGEDAFIVNIANLAKAVRPLPIMANPGGI